MTVTYSLLDKDQKQLVKFTNAACFSALPYLRSVDFSFTDIAYIKYKPVCQQVTRDEAIVWLSSLKDIGFPINQDPKEILGGGYLLCLEGIRKGKHIHVPEIGATLTLLRYLQEFSTIISSFLNILDIDPTIDKWLALQLAHIWTVQGGHMGDLNFGIGHCLFSWPYGGGNPYKTWQDVKKDMLKSPVWQSNFYKWSIHSTYGHQYSPSPEQQRTCKILLINNPTSLRKATTCLKSLYVPKATT